MSRDDLIQLEGVVTKILGYGTMEIECDDNIIVRGVLCGRMKKRRIKVMKGDRVQVINGLPEPQLEVQAIPRGARLTVLRLLREKAYLKRAKRMGRKRYKEIDEDKRA